MNKKRILLLIASNIWITTALLAHHNRAGEITYQQTGDYQIEGIITTYTINENNPADRDSLQLSWGDGQSQWLFRINGPDVDGNGFPDGEGVENNYKRNIYSALHTYADFGNYTLAMTDPTRGPGIINLNTGASENVPFHIQTEFTLSSQPNSSPILLIDPTDIGYLGMPFTHTPNGFDPDGDSIAYEMITPLMGDGVVVPGYSLLTAIDPSNGNQLLFNKETGLLIWDAPPIAAEYTIAIAINTYRNGVQNGRVIRDMQITVLQEENKQPMIRVSPISGDSIRELEVGDTIALEVFSTDENQGQVITISASSALFDYFQNPPDFEFMDMLANTGQATFEWIVTTDHLREQAHQIVFKTSDNLGLANYAVLRFRVKGLLDATIEPEGDETLILFPNPCSDQLFIKNNKEPIQHFSIWDVAGKKIRSGNLKERQEISVHDLPNGIYYLKINQRFIQSFVKE